MEISTTCSGGNVRVALGDKQAGGYIEIRQVAGDNLLRTTTADVGDLATVLRGRVHDLLDTVHVGGEQPR